MQSHKSWLLPAVAVVGAMLLAGGALLYLNPDYLNASASVSEESASGTVAGAPVSEASTCSGDCGDCSSASADAYDGECSGSGDCSGSGVCDGSGGGACSGSGDCDGAGTCSGGGNCDGEGTCSGGGDCDGAGTCSGGGKRADKVVCDRAEASSVAAGCTPGGCASR